jgi:hypothetical protein
MVVVLCVVLRCLTAIELRKGDMNLVLVTTLKKVKGETKFGLEVEQVGREFDAEGLCFEE